LSQFGGQVQAFEKATPSYIDKEHVDEFHAILDLFASGTGQDILDFKIPESKMDHKLVSFTRGSFSRPGSQQFTKEKYCDDNFFKRRLIEVRAYFSNFQPPHQR